MVLQELIYTSVAVPTGAQTAVRDILETSQRNNDASGVTGLLLFDGTRYIQVLEGAPESLDRLYANISRDLRHDALERLHRGPIGSRSFDTWRMAYEALPLGLLDTLAENIAVAALESEGDPADESFGARLNGMFMEALVAE